MILTKTQIQLQVTGQPKGTTCTWQTSNDLVLSSLGNGEFQGQSAGTAVATVTCGSIYTDTAVIQVNSSTPSGPIVITKGGTYSGVWNSNSPTVPAISIATDQPVTIENSVITSKGDLIDVTGVSTGANVTIQNVTGTALDPGVAGLQRGKFVNAKLIASLVVENCTMSGVSYGVNGSASTVSTLKIDYNVATNMEDRASDGNGGLTTARPSLGHFVILGNIVAPNGADIGWNQVINTIGHTSNEDVVNIYKSVGSANATITAHDNYFEGYSTAAGSSYNGTGLITDGNATAPYTAYVLFQNNEMVHMAGSGVAIAVGHDITVKGNRVVSCGVDAYGNWFAMPYADGVYLWNFYGVPQSNFYNLTIKTTAGGIIRPTSANTPMTADSWINTPDTNASDSIGLKSFNDPCLVNGVLNPQAENNERNYWAAKKASAGVLLGDQHQQY